MVDSGFGWSVEISSVRSNEVKVTFSETNPCETTFSSSNRKIGEIKGSRNRDSTALYHAPYPPLTVHSNPF